MSVENPFDNTFECAACHGTFEKGWTDDEAQAESKEKFGYRASEDGFVDELFAVICDDCFKNLEQVHKIGEAKQAEARKRREQRTAEYQAKIDALSSDAKRLLEIIERAMVNDYANFILYGGSRKPKENEVSQDD